MLFIVTSIAVVSPAVAGDAPVPLPRVRRKSAEKSFGGILHRRSFFYTFFFVTFAP